VTIPDPSLDAADGQAVLALARELRVDLVVVGPEAPLVAGVVDILAEAGGRVLSVTALGPDPATARVDAYAAADMIEFDGRQMRRDIALKAVR
jgi:phosphoribosylamine-glycine ligase